MYLNITQNLSNKDVIICQKNMLNLIKRTYIQDYETRSLLRAKNKKIEKNHMNYL